MPENSTNRGYPLPVATDAFTPRAGINALGVAIDADVQALADDVADASGIDDGAIGPAKLDRAYAESGNTYVRIGNRAGDGGMGTKAIAIGFRAQEVESGDSAIAIGNEAQDTASGSRSIAVGYKAQQVESGVQSIAIGAAAQNMSSGNYSIAIGSGAHGGDSGDSGNASGLDSIAIGRFANGRPINVVGNYTSTSWTGVLLDGVKYRMQVWPRSADLLIDGVLQGTSVVWPVIGSGAEVTVSTTTGDYIEVLRESLEREGDIAIGRSAVTDHDGGIAIGYYAYADTVGQVQIGSDTSIGVVQPPNALRVGVHDAILTTDTPTTGEVLRFDGSAWVADGAATAAQGALADSAVQPGDLQSLADAVDADVEALESRTITAGTGLTGGGDLSANRTLSVDTGGIDTAQLADGAVTQVKSSLGLGFGLGARPTSSRYLTLPGASVASFTAAWGRIYMMPLHLWAGTLTRIGIEVVTGQPSAQVRLGIYAARDTDGRPIPAVDPLLDAGAVDASTSGIKEITISHTVTTPGWVYLAAFVYGGSGTGIDLYGLSGAPITPITTVQSLVYGTGTTSALMAFDRPGETSLVQLNEFPSFGQLIPRIVVRY